MAGTDDDLGYKCNAIDPVQPEAEAGEIPPVAISSLFLEKLEFVKWMDQKFKWVDQKLKEHEMQAKRLAEIEDNQAKLGELILGRSARELRICAHEIWRRITQKRGVAIGDHGKQFFDPNVQDLVMKVAVAMGMVNQIPELKEMSRICIVAGDGAAHCSTVEALEDSVGICLRAMETFPSLRQSHPHECSTVSQYERFKELLPESFSD